MLFVSLSVVPAFGPADAAAQAADSLAVRAIALPEPWGEHPVGVITAVVVDSSRNVAAEEGREIPRPLLLRAWYPASGGGERTRTKPYMHPELAEAWRETLPAPPGWEDAVSTTAVEGAPPAEDVGPRPVILFSHGLSWPVENYQVLLEDLASRGWVVVGISHPGEEVLTRLPDGTRIPFAGAEWEDEEERGVVLTRKVDEMVRDAGVVLDWLQARAGGEGDPLPIRLDLRRGVGYAGHSLGGAAAAWALKREDRVVAAASWEGQVYRAEDRPLAAAGPLMYLLGGANRTDLAGLNYRGGGPDRPLYEVILRGAWHSSPSDLLYVYERYASRDWRGRHRREIDAERTAQITGDYLHAFFSRHLPGVGDESDLLDADGPDEAFGAWSYPEVEMRRSIGDGFWTAETRH